MRLTRWIRIVGSNLRDLRLGSMAFGALLVFSFTPSRSAGETTDTPFLEGPSSDLKLLHSNKNSRFPTDSNSIDGNQVPSHECEVGRIVIAPYLKKEYRNSTLSVIRRLIVGYRDRQYTVNLTVPIVYQVGQWRLSSQQIHTLISLKRRIANHLQECQLLETQTRQLQADWDKFVESATPSAALSKQ